MFFGFNRANQNIQVFLGQNTQSKLQGCANLLFLVCQILPLSYQFSRHIFFSNSSHSSGLAGLDYRFNPINQISFRMAEFAGLREMHRRLQAEKVAELAPVTHGNAISVYFHDPEGNRLELFLDTPWHCTQPCREPIDLSQPDEVIMATTERLVRGLPGFKPRAEWIAELRAKMGQAAGAKH